MKSLSIEKMTPIIGGQSAKGAPFDSEDLSYASGALCGTGAMVAATGFIVATGGTGFFIAAGIFGLACGVTGIATLFD